jgi:hypothetical protein
VDGFSFVTGNSASLLKPVVQFEQDQPEIARMLMKEVPKSITGRPGKRSVPEQEVDDRQCSVITHGCFHQDWEANIGMGGDDHSSISILCLPGEIPYNQ